MTIIKTYTQFGGLHHETGSVHNVLAHLGVKAPHNGQPISEALLLGISGGVAFGYFLFDYKGYAPLLSLISRNTFDPLETLLSRLAVPRDVTQSTKPEKAERALLDVIEAGQPAIVLADAFTLPYNRLPQDSGAWAMSPVVVYGYDETAVHIADRSHAPHTVDTATFKAARARIQKDKFRMTTLHAPDPSKLKDAVQKGIWQCAQLFTDKPPKGAATNFGFAAYRHWAEMLTNTRNPQGWARFFPAGLRLWSALAGWGGMSVGLVNWVRTYGAGDGMERGLYADFLDEAAALLKRPGLKKAAVGFRLSREAWNRLSELALPDDVPLCRETRELLIQRHDIFVEAGSRGLKQIDAIDARLAVIRALVESGFPMSDARIDALKAELAKQVMVIHDIERDAVGAMQSAMA
jgi:Butirosin biosynthesis protein H, N-terminal/Domain of unknown function (DUF4872)